jgi:NTP pyrophosphatase (non-canonical NTP hydrolase)
MELNKLSKRASEVKEKYHQMEDKKLGKRWTNAQVMEGFVGDVGELMKIIMAKEGLREMENIDEKLAHELSDCLYCVLVLAEKYNINLEKTFLESMDLLEDRILKEN